jgi:methylenetetrahydrofolate dehydrogenase (NADP+) / methenyltetrahydrofolate cyclohydrolase
MILVSGKKIAEERFLKLQERMKEEGISLSLAVIQVGENPISSLYVGIKKRELEKRGISVVVYNFKEDVAKEELQEKIMNLEEDGVIVQLPLPENMEKEKVLEVIPEEKDVDLLNPLSCGKFYKGESETTPPVVGAVQTILEENGIEIKGKNITIIGAGNLVGRPLALFFMREGGTVCVVNENTKDISSFTRNSQIVVSGAGVPELVTEDMIKENTVVIDAGTSSISGELKGDVQKEAVRMKTGLFAPVPGGVGPLTVYHLANNLFILKKKENERR